MWKWPTRKKIGGTQCKVELRKWKFDIWRWSKRKRERRKESYVKLMFWSENLYKEFGLECCRKRAVVLLFMFDAVVDGSSKIRRGNELKTKFAQEGIKYEVGDWVYLTLQPYVQVSVRQSHLPNFMIHFKGWLKLENLFIKWSCWKLLKILCVFYVSKLRKWKGHVTGMGALTACEDDELSAVEPQMILARRMHKRDNKVDVYVLVQCVKGNVVADATLV
ncbi:hypothetical protein Tco_0261143 [Tanacetum coccineum]